MHRAQEAGIDDVGLGALFGLYNYKFDLLGLLFLSLIHISEPTRPYSISYAVFCLKKKN